MKLTERLKVEHGVFLLQLRRLEDLLKQEAPREALQATVETIAAAEEHHTAIEDRLLYPALEEIVGEENPALRESDAEHRVIRALVERICSGAFEVDDVWAYVGALRAHLEREIHGIFALAEDRIDPARLSSMCNWDEEHVFDAVGRRQEWLRRLK